MMTFIGAFGCLILKLATRLVTRPYRVIFCPAFYLGGLSYFISAVINIIILKHMKYGIFLPLTSITYVWSMLLAYFVLHEKITREKIIGIALILIGAFLLVG